MHPNLIDFFLPVYLPQWSCILLGHYIKNRKNQYAFFKTEGAPLLDPSVMTQEASRTANQDARTNGLQSQVTVSLICCEPYFLCLPKDLAGQCVLSLHPDKPHLPHTDPIQYVTSRL